jgi:hypothetical protein
MRQYLSIICLLLLTNFVAAQRYDLGDAFSPSTSEFKLIGISSATGVSSYQYIRPISDYMFGRKIGDIIIGIKNGRIVTTVYDMIPIKGDIGLPQTIINLIQSNLPYPLALVGEAYGINIYNTSISISRSSNSLTFGKDRIMYFSSVKRCLLLNN